MNNERFAGKNALVLCGGGSRGAIEVGFYRALQELKIPVDLVVGTSVGAINGAFIAGGVSWRRLAESWSQVNPRELFHLNWQILSKGTRVSGLYKHEGLEKFLNRNLPKRRFQDLKIPLVITGTEVETGKTVIFDKDDLVKAILASVSIPGILPPVMHDGRSVIDGGVTGILPIKPAIDRGARTILAMRCECRTPSKRPLRGLRDILARSFSIALEVKHETDLLLYGSQVKMVVIEPCFNIEVDFLDFSRSAHLIELSYQFAKRELEKTFPMRQASVGGGDLKYCFCEIPKDELFRLAKEKFVEGRSTEELMQAAKSEEERGYVASVAVMDLSEKYLAELIRGGQKELSHVFTCRDRVVSVLKEHGIDCRRGICRTETSVKVP